MNSLQDQFDLTIGRLDRVLSQLIWYAELSKKSQGQGTNHPSNDFIDPANSQTLKHHAEDMIGAGKKILELLGKKDTGLSPAEAAVIDQTP